MRVFVLCALVACTYPEKEFLGPLTCFGEQAPTTADPLVRITGTTTNPQDLTVVPGVSVALQDATMGTISSTISDANGRFSITMNTNGTPVTNVNLMASAIGRINTYYFPSRPLTHDFEITPGLQVISSSESSLLALGANFTFTPGDGQILLSINDCIGGPQNGLSGATLTSSPPGSVRYFMGVQPNPPATATDGGGVVLMANLPPGKVTLTATVGALTLPPRTVTAVADAFTLTEIQP
jgi:hypothetical protein